MLFNSWSFLALAVVVYSLYYRLPLSGQNWLLLGASYLFYGTWDPRFLLLLGGSTVFDYVVGRQLAVETRQHIRRRWLMASLIGNLGVLAFFKYFGFFVDSARHALSSLGVQVPTWSLEIILPVGISFYTFQTLSYTIDVYAGRLTPIRSLRDFALFVAYFPQLVAGPIERATNLLPQIVQRRTVTLAHVHRGLWLISWGLFKKVAIADNLAILVDRTFAQGSGATGLEYLVAIYAFAYQIYCDFSGYSDMARGLAALMGIELMVNFRRPYLATDPRDFWRRWHISLSTWLRDYLYIPLGGSRGGGVRTALALFATMVLGGLWHGAAWTFVAWGAFHGAILIVHRTVSVDRGVTIPDTIIGRWSSRIAMFHLVAFGWLLFRAESLGHVGTILTAMTTPASRSLAVLQGLAAVAVVTSLLAFVERVSDDDVQMGPWRTAATALLLASVWVAAPVAGRPFLYFQF
jgi:D-alanyl-lipoteichoic acid acyltransferase DltB (MBOAT superfamily)